MIFAGYGLYPAVVTLFSYKKWKMYFHGLCIEECCMDEISFLRFTLFDLATSFTETRVIKFSMCSMA